MPHNEYYDGPSYGIEDKQDKSYSPKCGVCGREFQFGDIWAIMNGQNICKDCFEDYLEKKPIFEIAANMGLELEEYNCDDLR